MGDLYLFIYLFIYVFEVLHTSYIRYKMSPALLHVINLPFHLTNLTYFTIKVQNTVFIMMLSRTKVLLEVITLPYHITHINFCIARAKFVCWLFGLVHKYMLHDILVIIGCQVATHLIRGLSNSKTMMQTELMLLLPLVLRA